MNFDESIALKLRGQPLFRGLEVDEIREIVRLGHERRCAAGDVLFREGEEGREMFVILRGTLGLEKGAGGEDTSWKVTQLAEGAVIGEMALLTNEPRSLTVRALTEVELMAFTRADFERLVADTRTAAVTILRNLATVLAHRLRRMDEELHRFYIYDATRDRKIAEIIRLKDKLLSQWES